MNSRPVTRLFITLQDTNGDRDFTLYGLLTGMVHQYLSLQYRARLKMREAEFMMHLARRFAWYLSAALLLLCQFVDAYAAPQFVPSLMALDSNNQHLYLLERSSEEGNTTPHYRYRLWRKDLQSHKQLLVGSLGTEKQALPQHISGMIWDSIYQRLIFADAHSSTIFALDPHNFQRSIISNPEIGAGPTLGKIGELVLDSNGRNLIIVDRLAMPTGAQRVLSKVALDSGDRSTLYTTTLPLAEPDENYFVTFDPHTNQVFLAYRNGVVVIDPRTKENYILTDTERGIGLGPRYTQSGPISFDYNNHRLIVADPLAKNLMAIDFATGQRQPVLDAALNTAMRLCWPGALLVAQDQLFIADEGHSDWLHLQMNTQALQRIDSRGRNIASKCAADVEKAKATILPTQPAPRQKKFTLRNAAQKIKNTVNNLTAKPAIAEPITSLNRFEYLIIAFWNTAFVSVLVVSGLLFVVAPLWIISETMKRMAAKPRTFLRSLAYISLFGLGAFFVFLTIPVITGSIIAANFLTVLYTPIAFVFSTIISLILP